MNPFLHRKPANDAQLMYVALDTLCYAIPFENFSFRLQHSVFLFFFCQCLCAFTCFLMQTNEGDHIMCLSSKLYNDGSFVLLCDQH